MSILVLTAPQPQPQPQPVKSAQFVLSGWSYPDEYGQGIYMLRFYENSTGSWVAAPFYVDDLPYYSLHYYDSYDYLNWSAGVAMKIRCYTLLNLTLTGAVDEADGQNYHRHSVNVTNLGTTVFSQQNFTYFDVTPSGDTPQYKYDVILNFLPVQGLTYTATIRYDVFWG